MNKISILLCLSLFVFIFFNSKAKANSLDSLMQIVTQTSSNNKLELLEQYTRDYPTNPQLIEELEKEAIEQSNYLYLASAYKSKVYYYTRIGNQDSIGPYLNQTEKALKLYDDKKGEKISKSEKKMYHNIFKMLYTTKTAFYIHEGKYNLALFEINRVLESPKVDKTADFENQLYTLSGIVYLHTKKYNEAITSFKEAYKLVDETSNKKNIGKYSYYMALEGMINAYGGLKRYTDAILVSDTLINRIEKERKECEVIYNKDPETQFIYTYFKHKSLVYTALWNIKADRVAQARTQLDEVKKFIEKTLNTATYHTDFDVYYAVEAEYFLKIQKYNIAEKYITDLINRLSIKDQLPLYIIAKELHASILNAQGKSKEAYHMAVELTRMNDSINITNFSSQLAEMNIVYETDKSKLLANQRAVELKNTYIILSVICLAFLASILTAYRIYQNRKKILEKNKQLYEQYKLIEIRNKKIKELQAIKNSLTEKEEESTEEDPYQILIEKVETYLDESKAFLNPEIKREDIALYVGTNRQYLIEAIKEKTGKTFNEYINSYRIKYAYDLIIDGKGRTISDVLNKSGFLTRATFYKTFKGTYGLTPIELRELLKE